MATKSQKEEEHMFSIELKSKRNLKSITLPDDGEGNVLVEGFLGKLQDLNFTEGVMFEIKGTKGTFRMDFSEKELERLLPKKTNQTLTGR